ncbi:hypothetical protein J6524_23175 [Bradyrhizobium sp. WSM 1738]|uniref:hypothetical protein n=1 Tax=Bradyrhizobium hereditatis TaxID=2821405 RepID=UPI001CE3471F|nr:hypothetical protein [Bradyrhizobium hereditatis]MCA6117753.1 hypothetical protein [Bradyrhizobium hereditatis]
MAEGFNEARRNIVTFLSSLRQSIDRPFRVRLPKEAGDRERLMQAIMMVEEARIRFNMYTRYQQEPSADEWAAARQELVKVVNLFARTYAVDTLISDRRFIFRPLLSAERENPTPFMQKMLDPEKSLPVMEALAIFREYLEQVGVESSNTQGSLSFDDLEHIVPQQQVAPVQFDVVDGRIVVSQRAPKAGEADRANVRSALEHIRGSGEQLINNLENSNCDKRLLESVKELQSQLVSDGNIIKIGLTNLACSVMSAQFQPELPDAIVGMFNAYNASISLYVAQFPEWDQFTQKAAAIDLDEDDIAELDITAGEIVEGLTKNPALADAEVPKTITAVRQFLAFPGSSSKRAAFALVRTIENLVSSIVRHSMGFFSKTAEKTVDAGSTAASKAIIGLLGIALMSASGIGSAAVRAGAPWVKQAAEIIQKQIEKVAE